MNNQNKQSNTKSNLHPIALIYAVIGFVLLLLIIALHEFMNGYLRSSAATSNQLTNNIVATNNQLFATSSTPTTSPAHPYPDYIIQQTLFGETDLLTQNDIRVSPDVAPITRITARMDNPIFLSQK